MSVVSSVGELGLSPRSDARLYLNNDYVVTPDRVNDFSAEVVDTVERFRSNDLLDSTDTTRFAAKVIVSSEAISQLLSIPEVAGMVEAVAPLHEPSNSIGEYLLFLAENKPARVVTAQARASLVASVNSARRLTLDISKNIRPGNGLTEVDSVSDSEGLLSLWGSTFGWTPDGVGAFAENIIASKDIEPKKRTVWFGGLEDKNGLAACAMAERLEMPSINGCVSLVEHTEWATRPDRRNEGLGRIVVKALTTRIMADLQDVHKLVYAECNILSGAHVVAVRSGFEVPSVRIGDTAPGQILFNNVKVGDGLTPYDSYRSFLLLAAPNVRAQ